MKEKNDTTIHSAVINQAISYIFDHIDEDISVDDVAKHCLVLRRISAHSPVILLPPY